MKPRFPLGLKERGLISWLKSRNIYGRGKGKIKVKIFRSIAFFLFVIQILSYQSLWRICARVIDGYTIVLDGNEKVRLIGIDAPQLMIILVDYDTEFYSKPFR